MPSPLNNTFKLLVFSLGASFLLASCCEDPVDPISEDLLPIEIEVPAHFRSIEIPTDNLVTEAKIALGKKLFYDPILSVDSTVSCGSCHFGANAFSDPAQFSVGVNGGKSTRQAMAIMNLAFAQHLFWDGRSASLEEQVIDPILNPVEMGNDTATVMQRIRNNSYYDAEFKRVFDATEVRFSHIEKAIATFERSVVSYESKFDQYLANQDTSIFTASERRGFELYFTEEIGVKHAECFHCHGGFNLDEPTGAFRNNGLDEFYDDLGRANVTQNNKDIGKFRVPSLRNIEYSAPYMHDGRFATLEEVVAHYASGGATHFNRDPLIPNIQLDSTDQADIIAFLKTFSDPGFLVNPEYLP